MRSLLPCKEMLLFALVCIVPAGPAYSQGGGKKAPGACDVMTEKDAVALAGGPLGEVTRDETKPTAENGHDHTTVCGFFPKGYNLRKADRPPDRGILVQLHTMRNKADAKQFYEAGRGMAEDRAKVPGGAKVVPVAGTGESAYLQTRKLEPEPGAAYEIAYVYILKGNVAAQVTAWKKGAAADETAKSAAKQVIAKLP